MLRKLLLMLCVENNLNKMAYIMFALPYFDVSGFLFKVSQPPEIKTHQNGSKPPQGTQRHQNKAMQT